MAEFTTRDGCTISYNVAGSGDHAVVILPGWSQTAAMFDRCLPLLPDGLRVATYDHRNHGESGRSEGGARIATLASDLRQLLDHLDLDKVSLIGHSMGCSVAWSYLDIFGTDCVDRLVLIDQPSVCALMPWLEASDAAEVGAIMDFAGAATFAQGLLGPDSDTVRSEFLRSMLSPDISDDDFAWLLSENMKLEMPFGAKLLIDHVMQDWRDVLPRIDVPTLVVGGEVSHVVASSQEWNTAQIPGAELVVFTREEGGSHFPFFENPEPFARRIGEFLVASS